METPEAQDERRPDLVISWHKPSQQRRREIVAANAKRTHDRPMRSETRSRLLKAIAQGRIWLDQLITGTDQTVHGLAKSSRVSERHLRSALNLALLAPDIVEAAIDGRLSRGMTVTQLTDLPTLWTDQRQRLGLA